MLDDLRSMAVFAAVVREGSFRGAGRALQLSASVVSHHVSLLESRVGHALLYRTTRQLSLTSQGEPFFEACARAVDAAQEGLNRLHADQKALIGRLKIGAPALLAQGPFMQDVWAFAQAHPGVNLDIRFSDDPSHQIQDSVDVTIRVGWLEDSSLRARKLFSVCQMICAAPSYIAGRPPVLCPADLERLQWIGSSRGPHFVDLMPRLGGQTERVKLDSRIEVDSGLAARALALVGAGGFIALDFNVAASIEKAELIQLLPDWELPQPSFYAVWPSNVVRGSLASRFVEHLSRLVGSQN